MTAFSEASSKSDSGASTLASDEEYATVLESYKHIDDEEKRVCLKTSDE